MPYKLSADKHAVMKQTASGWIEQHRYSGRDAEERARKLLTALNINVTMKEEGKALPPKKRAKRLRRKQR